MFIYALVSGALCLAMSAQMPPALCDQMSCSLPCYPGKGVCQGCIWSPCSFNLYAEYITQNTRLDESQAGSKTAGRNIRNLRYADDTCLMGEGEKKLKSLLMRVKEKNEKAGLKLSIQKLRS